MPKEELFTALWPDVAVTDNALTQAVSELRQALGDEPSKPDLHPDGRAPRLSVHRARGDLARRTRPSGPAARRARARAPAAAVIAVLDFANVSTDREFAWLSSGIAETVTNDLAPAGTLRIIDRVAPRRSGAARRHRPRGAAERAAPRPGRGRQLPARRRAAADHRARRRRATGEALADAKADGRLDAGVRPAGPDRRAVRGRRSAPAPRTRRRARSHRETSSLEAYQAFTEGRIRLESLDASLVPQAIADFERAIALDPRYPLAHVGLAMARFWQYEMSRARNQPDAALLARAIDPVRRAIELQRDLAEAHATLSFLLVSAGRFSRGRWRRPAARSRSSPATGDTTSGWRHAAWGDEPAAGASRGPSSSTRTSRSRTSRLAMVHIARGALDRAESVLREGTIVQDRQANLRQRYPGQGPALAARARAARPGRPRGGAGGVRSRGRRRSVAALCGGVRHERLRRRRLRRAPRRRPRGGARRCSAARSSCIRSTPGPSSASGAAHGAHGDRRAAEAAFERATAAIDALAPRRPRQRGHARRSLPSRRRRPARRGHRRACSAWSSGRSCPSRGGPSRSSRCSRRCAKRPHSRRFCRALAAARPLISAFLHLPFRTSQRGGPYRGWHDAWHRGTTAPS